MKQTSCVALPRGRLLVIDDDPDLRDSMQLALEDLGQQVDVSPNGAQALSRLRSGERYDLVFCDVSMPGMSGWEVAAHIRALAPETRVFVLTGAADELGRNTPGRALVAGVLCKPVELDDLERLLARQLSAMG